jgi:2-C-methyl-D-erythritol 4-phosphate cytidylyltransferase/2-C-methyl-D-erythritol 2,4-cyclodiphosphate synthase
MADIAGHEKLLNPVIGGDSRSASVRAGLESLEAEPPGHVLIHDAARPFIDADVITRVLEALDDAPGAIAALPVMDTIRRAKDSPSAHLPEAGETLERSSLWRAQTPQGFHFQAILDAHRTHGSDLATDDAAIAEAAGLRVVMVTGSPDNMKITQAEDFGMAEALLKRSSAPMETRMGQGFDVHAFTAGDHVMLCGVRIAHDKALAGHSDADVALHALTDALFGALGDGDIGTHFPPSEAQWKGAASDIFLKKAVDQVTGLGGRLVNVDITIIGEEPKIKPHRDALEANLSSLLGLHRSRVNVKATTTERLGFPGRQEGLAALAVCSVLLPATEKADAD